MPRVDVPEITGVRIKSDNIEQVAETINRQKVMLNNLNMSDVKTEVNITVVVNSGQHASTLIINPDKATVKNLIEKSIAEGNATIQELTSEIENTKLTVTLN